MEPHSKRAALLLLAACLSIVARSAYALEGSGKVFSDLDADKDGKVTHAELVERLTKVTKLGDKYAADDKMPQDPADIYTANEGHGYDNKADEGSLGGIMKNPTIVVIPRPLCAV